MFCFCFLVYTERTDDVESYQNESGSEECDNEDQFMDDDSFHVAAESKLYALVLTPTRELAMQVHKHLTLAAAYTGIKVSYRQSTNI